MVIRSTAAFAAFVPYTLDRNNRQSDVPDRASLPRKRARSAATEKETKGLRTIRTAVPLPFRQALNVEGLLESPTHTGEYS